MGKNLGLLKLWFCPPKPWHVETDFWSSLCVLTTWFIWKARCLKIFQDKMLSPTNIAYQINSLIFKLFGQHDIQAQFSQNHVTRSIWIPPSEKQVK
ncbi:hypothetical protein FRX31_006187, partial [Thalictrum thalictroides]